MALFTTGKRWRDAGYFTGATVAGFSSHALWVPPLLRNRYMRGVPITDCFATAGGGEVHDPLGNEKFDAFQMWRGMDKIGKAFGVYAKHLGYSKENQPPKELWQAYVSKHTKQSHGILDKIASAVKPFAEAATEVVSNVVVPGSGSFMHKAIQAHEHHQGLGHLAKDLVSEAMTLVPDVGLVPDKALASALSLVQRTRAGDPSARAAIQAITQGVRGGNLKALRSAKIMAHAMRMVAGGASAGESLPPNSPHGRWLTGQNGTQVFIPQAMASVPSWLHN